jgi:DNA end-binding protein Ku
MRAIWEGAIAFGLVNIPIRIYPAARHNEIEFAMLCDKCKSHLHYERYCPKCKKTIEWEHVLKGFKLGEKYIPITNEEFESAKPKSSRTIEILKFVNQEEIDPIYMEKSYYVVPNKSERAYYLLKEALHLTGKAGIGKIIFRNKEHLVMLRGFKNGLVMTELHYAEELLDINSLPELKQPVPTKREELILAKALINKLSSHFNPKDYRDEFKEEIMKLIEKKAKGRKVEIKIERGVEETKDLMKALKASIKVKK